MIDWDIGLLKTGSHATLNGERVGADSGMFWPESHLSFRKRKSCAVLDLVGLCSLLSMHIFA